VIAFHVVGIDHVGHKAGSVNEDLINKIIENLEQNLMKVIKSLP